MRISLNSRPLTLQRVEPVWQYVGVNLYARILHVRMQVSSVYSSNRSTATAATTMESWQ